MAKRSNNSLGRRTYGGKPYDANNSFVKKMANKVTDFIPQKSWISKWFNASQDNGDASGCSSDNLEDAEAEEDVQQPPAKRPRIRMDVTHPPGTFFIRPRDRDSSNENDTSKDPYLRGNETGQDFLEPSLAGPSGIGRFISSTPAVQTDMRSPESRRAQLNCLMPTDNNGAINGADDNSESSESTSGCSSLIRQTDRQDGGMNAAYRANMANRKRLMDDKLGFSNHLQSPRCLFLDSNSRESLSSRRPSFNASVMSNTLDRASSLSSPFYSGNVTFGGANALGHYKRSRSLFNSTNEYQLKVPRRTSVQVKPSTESIDTAGMSQTAKRILEAMEYFSSPISDAKKIPVKKSDESISMSGKKRPRDEQGAGPTTRVGLRHLTRELAVPTVPELLKLRRRQKLQDTTIAARKIVSAMSGPPQVSTSTVTSKPATEDYHLRTELDQDSKYHGKLRAKSKKNPDEEAPAPSLNLPRISLAITSLPSFEPLPTYTKPSPREAVSVPRDNDTSSSYKFASPIKMSEAAWNLKSINNFSFSKPIIAEGKDDSQKFNAISTLKTMGDSYVGSSISDGAAKNFMWTGSSTAPRLKTKTKASKEKGSSSDTSIVKESSELKTGSVMDILGGKSPGAGSEHGFSSQKSSPQAALNIWECAECYIKNDSSEKVCVACKAAKPTSTGSKISSQATSVPSNVGPTAVQQSREVTQNNDCFGSQFKMSTNQWECSSCLLRNKQVDLVCVACSSPKPGNKAASANSSSVKSDIMDKFKPTEGSWECSGCMLRNPGTVITCPCCNAAKPSSLNAVPKKTNLDGISSDKSGKSSAETLTKITNTSDLPNKFKPASGTWECSSCLVRNAETASLCVCCSNPKPGSQSKGTTASATSSTTPKSATIGGWGDKFKKPEGSWSCDSCMLQNKTEVTECVACGGLKPGATPKSTPKTSASAFSFGIPNNVSKSETASSNGFTFGVNSAKVQPAGGSFTFGIPPSEPEKNKDKPTGFVFAAPKSPDFGNIKFGVNASETSDTTKASPGSQAAKETFSFGLPKSVAAQDVSTEKETICGGSSSIGNGEAKSIFGVDAIKATTNTTTANSIFGAATSDKSTTKPPGFPSEKSQTTNSNATDGGNTPKISNAVNDKQPSTITTPLTTTSLSSSTSAPASAAFTFSQPNSKLNSQPTASPSFGGPSMSSPAPVASSTFSIASQKTSGTTPNHENKQSAMSNFGVGTTGSMSSPFGAAPSSSPSPSPSLGESANGAKNTALPSFGTTTNNSAFFTMPEGKKSSAFGTVEKNSQIFGSSESKPTPSFDCNDKTTSNAMFNSPLPTFGRPAAAASQPSLFGQSTAPVFGNSPVPSFGKPTTVVSESTNMFASGKSSETPGSSSTSLFTFGGAAPQTNATPTSGGYNFAATGTPANSAIKPIFPFGGATGMTTPQSNEVFGSGGANTGGTFGTPASINPTPSPFTFNAPPKQEPPSFGQATTAIPSMFGAQPATPSIGQTQSASNFLPNAPASSTGFNFGAPASAPTSGVFSFGGSMAQPATAPPSGFNFNAPSPSPAIAFDPNTRPSFNFTGGTAPTVFNATPQVSTPQPGATRKIKKAVRRMPQR